ncbi:MAG: acyl-CoA thioesterase [Candidatus Obscuribacterales bacterium]|nr:acyl-CoA thioesterase [Candidatus Obscuribacterales bacterium]
MSNEMQKATVADTSKQSYKHWTSVTIRYGDTDRQGHVNNAVYSTFFESGRCAFLFDGERCVGGPDKSFVIVKLSLDYLAEINFPGIVEVGSRILKTGTSSFTVAQAIFKDGKCCSTSESVIVQIDDGSKKASSMNDELLRFLKTLS